ncbi:hypothetical protein Cci01nite_49930 [Catellatospora citrea]|uniref:Uncharacterized protein n=1 Tax=Catellatospora citrea TaxID=53366 RepID=A0A8J3KFV9_9ACTN|nr:hypothetical protein Cci01nite_49930 [Catellatospora citrea]
MLLVTVTGSGSGPIAWAGEAVAATASGTASAVAASTPRTFRLVRMSRNLTFEMRWTDPAAGDCESALQAWVGSGLLPTRTGMQGYIGAA